MRCPDLRRRASALLRAAGRPARSRLRLALPVALGLLIGSGLPALGQIPGPGGQLAVRSDGFVFWIQDGQRHVVYPAQLSDQQIDAIPDGAPLNASLQPGAVPGGVQAAGSMPPGSSRANRLLLGQFCACTIIRGPGQRSDLQIRVASVQREAWAILNRTNPANQRPKDGFEYIMVTLDIKYANGPRDLPVSVDRFDFTMLDANDSLYVPAFVIEPQPLVSVSAYPGMSVTGTIAYQVPSSDSDPVLVWRYSADSPVWFGVT